MVTQVRRSSTAMIRCATTLCALSAAMACSADIAKKSGSGEPARIPAAAATAPLPSRAEVVQRADELAVKAAHTAGADGARMAVEAASLRGRIWRLERHEADALEAAELLRTAAAADWNGACAAALDLAVLEGELRHDPTHAYRSTYLARAARSNQDCTRRADAILATLSAFAPTPQELSELDRQAAHARSARGGAVAVSIMPNPYNEGPVIVPKVPERPHPDARITDVETYGGKDAARVVVFVTEPTVFSVGALASGNGRGPRLFIDINSARYQGKLNYDATGLVERVRLGQQKGATRVVLDLMTDVYRKVFYVPEPFRLIIDVSREPPKTESATAEGPRDIRRVVLDPGHGGHDPGATGTGGLREKDVALDIAHRAAPLIARELGISTLLTRDSDVFVPLDERVARANAFGADLFVSIHCNASENVDSHGIATFVLDASRDDLAARIAARENAASPAAAAELANVMSRVLDAGSIERSAHFAKLLQRSALSSVASGYQDTADLGVRSAGFYVLAGAHMPAVLFETSFISHPTEESRLDSGDYRQKLADAIVNAVRAYQEGV